MIIKTDPDKHVMYFDTVSELYFAGEGPFLFNNNPDDFFGQNVVCTTTTFDIEDGAWIQLNVHDHEHKFYTYPERNLLKVLDLFYKHHEGVLSLSKERFERMLSDQKEASDAGWERSPGQGAH